MPIKKNEGAEKEAFTECAAALMRMRNAIEDFRAAYQKSGYDNMAKMAVVVGVYAPDVPDVSLGSMIGHNVICQGLVASLVRDADSKKGSMSEDDIRAEGLIKGMLNGLFRPGKDK